MGEIRHIDRTVTRKAFSDLHNSAEEFCTSEGLNFAVIRGKRRDLSIALGFPTEAHRRSILDPVARLAERVYRDSVRIHTIEFFFITATGTAQQSSFQTHIDITVIPSKKPSGLESEKLGVVDRKKDLLYEDQFRIFVLPERLYWKNQYNSIRESVNPSSDLTPPRVRRGIVYPEAVQSLAELLVISQETPVISIDPQAILRHPSSRGGIQAMAALIERYFPRAKGLIKPPIRSFRVDQHSD